MGERKKKKFRAVAECLYLHPSGIYYALAKVGGKQYKQSLRTKDRQLANRKVREFREKVTRIAGPELRRIRFSELAQKWLESVEPERQKSTHKEDVLIVQNLNAYFGKFIAREITRRNVDEWKQKRSQAKVKNTQRTLSARRFNYELAVLRRIFRYARDVLSVVLEDVTVHVKRQAVKSETKKTPTREQFASLIKAMGLFSRNKAPGGAIDVVKWLAYTGCRVGALSYFRWEHVNWTRNEVTLRNTKHRGGGRDFTVPMNPALREFLEDLKKRIPRGGSDESPFKVDDIKKSLQGACLRAELPNFTHHSLRHFFASNAVEAGVDFATIANWLDHSDGGLLAATTYGHLREDHSARMAAKITFATPPPALAGEA